MRASTTRLLTWSLWTICLVITIGALVLGALSDSAASPGRFGSKAIDVAVSLAILSFPTVGALIAWRRPENPIGWIFIMAGVAAVTANFATEYGDYALVEEPSLPAGAAAFWLQTWVWVPAVGTAGTFLVLLFPDGKLPSARWRPVAWAAGVSIAATVLAYSLKPGRLYDAPVPVGNPVGLEGLGGLLDVVGGIATLALVASILAALVSLVVRFRRARGDERQQLKWFVSAIALLAITGPGTMAFAGGSDAGALLMSVAFLAIPASAAVAIFKYRLYDIDLIVNRALVYGSLTAMLVGCYALVVAALGEVFQARGSFAASLAGAGLVAVLIQPLRDRLQRGVNRLMYGERDDPYAVVARLGQRLEATVAPDGVLPSIVETVAQALRLPYAAIDAGHDGPVEIVAAYPPGSPAPPAEREILILPLAYQAETVGRLIIAARAPGESFSPADRHLLDDLARHAGVAVHAVRLTADLQRSRERLVAALEEERRRLRRDLHDGLGPQLAAIAVKLDAARNLLPHNPAVGDGLLAELKNQTQAALADIRRLVYDLRPPSLDELGLVSALREHASLYSLPTSDRLAPNTADGRLMVAVEAPEQLPALPAAVEVAAYRIALEGLTNVVRHAFAHSCTIRLALAEGMLQLTIADDGRGPPADLRAGVGLISMRERAAELGGTLVLERTPSGETHLLARLPLMAAEA